MISSIFALALCFLGNPPETSDLERYEATERHMGVVFNIVLYSESETKAKLGFEAAFDRIDQLDRTMSDYDSDSELSRLSNSSPTSEPVKVSDDLWRVLVKSQDLSEKSDGAFDVTVGALTKLWRRARRQHELPSEERLKEAMRAVGYRHLSLDCGTKSVSLGIPNMRLDLGGIAKGYAADEALAALKTLGISRALVNASGDIALGDSPPGKPGWKIGIAPLNPDTTPSRFLELSNCAVATSGDAWQFVEVDGRRYSHIIDPRTGLGLMERSSVTIVAPTCTDADGLASAVSVLGPKAGVDFVDKIPKTVAIVVRLTDDKPETIESKSFSQMTK